MKIVPIVVVLLLLSLQTNAQPSGKKEGVVVAGETPSKQNASAAVPATTPTATVQSGATPQALTVTNAASQPPPVQIRSDGVNIRLAIDVGDPAALADAWTGRLAYSKQKLAIEEATENLRAARVSLKEAREGRDDNAIARAKTLVVTRDAALSAARQPHEPTLLIDDIEVRLARPVGFSYANKRVWFEIQSLPDELQQGPTRDVSVSVDYPEPRGGGARGGLIRLVVVNFAGMIWAWVLGAVILILVIILGRRTNLLRDNITIPPGKAPPRWWQHFVPNLSPAGSVRRSFSLGRCQMAFWTVLVAWGWLYLWLASNQSVTVSSSMLAVMGIATGTLLGARVIDQSKEKTVDGLKAKNGSLTTEQNSLAAQATVAPRQTLTTPMLQAQTRLAAVTTELQSVEDRLANMQATSKESEGLLEDLLSDEGGISIHRLQMVLWTLVLGGFFIRTVLGTFSMPELDGNLLALMGLSSGAYLGFKLPEKNTT